MSHYDVAILGGGSAAEAAGELLVAGGRSVVVIEERYVGGECPFLSCMPSKALLHAASSGMSWQEAVVFRDEIAQHQDDSGHAKTMQHNGIELVRGRGVITGPGRLLVADHVIEWHDLVIATGAAATIPPIDGIGDVEIWTSEDALTLPEQPGTLLVLGGGPIGCELAQAYARLGSEVTLIEVADRLLANEPKHVGEILTEALRHDGVEVLTGTSVERVEPDGDGVIVVLDDGDRVEGDRLLVAVGKRPRTTGLGLESLNITPRDNGALEVNGQGRVAGSVWAAGDVTALAPYTHGANTTARIVARAILGEDARLDLRAMPRVVYTDPTVLCVGDTTGGTGVVTAFADVSDTARAHIEKSRPGRVELFADLERGVLVGAAAIGPHADDWAGQLVLAIQAEVSLQDLADTVQAFPTYAEPLQPAYLDLIRQRAERSG
ncbi:MAG TPA: NAD(P)/FAD-dependent oxidoreductase [Mycobacteriales bacterium]|nr:NAD(P)/FAD-dependent oxidoreductase [Mycobacteriales bacterium]